eukprot:TRINITY_DN685_c1_g1_i1.p2 TRINITY_DN685_c1_g1~~TRINITY_DN685_c1_g1_i1.p2  ORF type:complete len:168 (+),score=55.14 TRINITY_DN685_c1_g1_i1:171-674(+)
MQIFARIPAAAPLALEVAPETSAEALRVQLQAATGIPAGELALSFGGQPMEDGCSLVDVGAGDESTLEVSLRLNGGGDGTPAMGKRHKKTHGLCPRCGKRSYHLQKKRCASCGYPAAKIRSYEWSKKAKRRRAPGTGRMAYKKTLARKFKNGFRSGTTAPARKKNQK